MKTMHHDQLELLDAPAEPSSAPKRDQAGSMPKGRSHVVHFSSRSDEWSTPRFLFEQLNREFHFTLDPCSTHANAKCRQHFTQAEDGLAQDWVGHVVFMNPPYGRQIGLWMRKAFESAAAGATVVCLVPSRTDTKWWHTYAIRGKVRFIEGRLKFGNSKNAAPFPSAIVTFHPPIKPLTYE
jgi:phage N-6-adenine-methyltransferase